VTQSAGSGEVALPEYCGCVIPDAGSETWGHSGDCGHVTSVNDLGRGYPGAAGRVTLSARTGRWCHPGHCGHETSGTESGCWLILETVDVIPCMWSGRKSP